MKLALPLVTALIFTTAAATAAVDYTAICNSSKLIASDRHACRVAMTAAAGEAEQAKVFRAYQAKIESLLTNRG